MYPQQRDGANAAWQLSSGADQIGDPPDQKKCASNEQDDHDQYTALILAVLPDRPGPVGVGWVVDDRHVVAFVISIAAFVEIDPCRGRLTVP
jgi:hypothetical protein